MSEKKFLFFYYNFDSTTLFSFGGETIMGQSKYPEILNDLNDLDLNDRNDQIPAPYAIITRCICLMKSLRFTNVSPKVSRHFRSFSGYSRKLRVSMSPFMLM